jgi:hypothetical protein
MCKRPVSCPFAGAVEIAYNILAGLPCATEGAVCSYCTCQLGNGLLNWACQLPQCY